MYFLKCVPLPGTSCTCTKQEITSHFYGINTQKRHPQPQVPHITLTLSTLLTLHICSPSGKGHILTAIHPDLISQPSIQISPHCHPSRSHLTAIHLGLYTQPSIQISHQGIHTDISSSEPFI